MREVRGVAVQGNGYPSFGWFSLLRELRSRVAAGRTDMSIDTDPDMDMDRG